MAINTCRSPRLSGKWLSKVATPANVGPGTYTSNRDSPDQIAIAPFSSLQERLLNPNCGTSRITPGPGSYSWQEPPGPAELPGPSSSSFSSRAARLAPTAPGSSIFKVSTIEANPGPGSYKDTSAWRGQQARELVAPVKPVLEVPERSAPSIPARRGPRSIAEQEAEPERPRCSAGESVGPGAYEVAITTLSLKTTQFGKSKQARNLWEPSVAIDSLQPAKDVPGPGSYERPAAFGAGRKEDDVEDSEQPTTRHFFSQAAMAHQVEAAPEKIHPGPGAYEKRSELDKKIEAAKGRETLREGRTRFDSTIDRVGWSRSVYQPFKDAYHIEHVPGPGHYREGTPGGFSKPTDNASATLTAGKKPVHGVHHPAIVRALHDTQDPIHAFQSTDDRPCLRPMEQTTPSPSAYNPHEATGLSMSSALQEREKVGKMGIFGSTCERFVEHPLHGKQGQREIGVEAPSASPRRAAHSEPRHMFKSTVSRFRTPAGPRDVQTHVVGKMDQPCVGSYDVTKEPTYRSPYRTPRQDHLAFGTNKACKPDREIGKSKTEPIGSDPGYYNPMPPKRVIGGAKLEDSHKPSLVGCTAEHVGPGSYSDGISVGLLKKSFNVTTAAAPQTAREPLGRRRGLA